jgi:hypothetical protein
VALDTSVTSSYPQPGANGSAGDSYVPLMENFVRGEYQHSTWPAPRTRRIAILGFADTVRDAPVNDPSWELWAMNGFWRAATPDFGITAPEERYSAWFDMHTLEYSKAYGAKAGFGDAQVEWLAKPHPFPIYMLQAAPDLPSVQEFPVERVVESVGRDYFTSTVAYAIALAASMSDVAEIGLWGIDLAHDTEYGDQRPCAEYHIARAEGKGIKVTTHERSALMKQRNRYGYEPKESLARDLRASLEANVGQLTKAIDADKEAWEILKSRMHTNDGAVQMLRTLLGRLDLYERGGRF